MKGSSKPSNDAVRGVRGYLRTIGIIALAALLLSSGTAPAQKSKPGPTEAAQGSDDQILLPHLKGIRLVDNPAKLVTQARAPGITVAGRTMPGIARPLRHFIGQPLTRAALNEISATIIAFYRARQHPFVDVTFAQQDITGGVVQAVVTEFRVGAVKVRGNKWFSGRVISAGLRVSRGDRIDAARLNEDMNWLNRTSYRQVKLIAEKSATPGATDLVLQTEDRFPWRFSVAYDNSGVPITGRDRWSAGIDWGNAFWLGQDLSYQFISSDNFWLHPTKLSVGPGRATFAAHQISYTAPLAWHDAIVLFGDYERQVPRLGPFFQQAGTTWQGSLRYFMALRPIGRINEQLQLGYDFKHTDNNLDFGGFAISRSGTTISQFPIIYDAAMNDTWGQTHLTEQLVISPGNMTSANSDEAFQPSLTHIGTPFAKARYVYDNLAVTRVTRLPFDASWILRAQGQWASVDLLPSEQLGAGGVASVRGYDVRSASGTLGFLAGSELRSPAFSVLDRLSGLHTGDQLQFDAFWDFGSVWQKQLAPGEPDGATLQSVGAGAHYVVGRFVDLRFEYGWRLRDVPGVAARGSQYYLSAVIGN